MMRVEAVLFDLDGTLVDTLADITWCLNQVLLERGRPGLTPEAVRNHIGGGTGEMIKRVALQLDIADAPGLHRRYVTLYAQNLTRFSQPFPGVPALLQGCRQLGVPLAIVTNKAEVMAMALARELLSPADFGTVLGQRQGRPLKPEPDIAWEAARQLSADPRHCLFVGDTPVDLQTARAAGMRSVAVTWGYGQAAALQAQAPDFCCERPGDLLRILQRARVRHGNTVESD